MEHIVFLDHEGISHNIQKMVPDFPHTWTDYEYTPPELIVERLKDATIAITCSVPLREAQLRQLPKLRMISMALTGTDIVDVEYCRERGIDVRNVPGYAENTVAEHTLAMIFALVRQTNNYHNLMRDINAGKIALQNLYLNFRIRDVKGLKLAIIGNGPIGRRLGDLGCAVGMDVLFHDRFGKYTGSEYKPLNELLQQCNVLAICCPLTSETHNLIHAEHLKMMKRDAIVVNTARGGIVNEKDLIEALLNEQIGGVALDVVEDEPIQLNNPILQVVGHPNLILNPHVAWSSENAMQGLMDRAIQNIKNFIDEEQLKKGSGAA
ncbi:NAD(P)-dependent oxidoreductase [Acinetobacter pseudolwoffii]